MGSNAGFVDLGDILVTIGTILKIKAAKDFTFLTILSLDLKEILRFIRQILRICAKIYIIKALF